MVYRIIVKDPHCGLHGEIVESGEFKSRDEMKDWRKEMLRDYPVDSGYKIFVETINA